MFEGKFYELFWLINMWFVHNLFSLGKRVTGLMLSNAGDANVVLLMSMEIKSSANCFQ
jgi:hypothetical protein